MSRILHITSDTLKNLDVSRYSMASTRMLIEGGYIQPLGDGLFAYLPLGMSVMNKIWELVTKEFKKLGGEEILLPLVNPGELWSTSGRSEMIDRQLTSFEDRCGNPLVLSPMHEEASVKMLSQCISSVDQLPRLFYQLQNKFRDEALDETGILKAREFIMSDGYSFHRSFTNLNNFMPRIHALYGRLFSALGLEVTNTQGAANFTGGNSSYDFLMKHPLGEDVLVFCPECGYNANQDVAVAMTAETSGRLLPLEEVKHDDCFAMKCFRRKKGLPESRTADCSIYQIMDGYVMTVCRSDKKVSIDKLARVVGEPIIAELSEDELQNLGYSLHLRPKRRREKNGPPTARAFLTPLSVPNLKSLGLDEKRFIVAVDSLVAASRNLAFSKGFPGEFLINMNFGRDYDADVMGDFALVQQGDRCYHCGHNLELENAIKIASVYRIGDYYSRKFDFKLTGHNGDILFPAMGAYGIGFGRLLACLVEAHSHGQSFFWPLNIAPYKAVMVIVGKSATIHEVAGKLHNHLSSNVLLDDRKIPITRKFRELDKTGIPIRIIISGQTLDDGTVMIWHRRLCKPVRIPLTGVEAKIREIEVLEDEQFRLGQSYGE